MAHHFQLGAGSLTTVKYSNLTSVYFDFFIHDEKSLLATYCWYGSDIVDSKKFEDAQFNNKVHRHQAGIAASFKGRLITTPLLLQKPLDSSRLKGAICSLSMAHEGNDESGTATLFLHKPPAVQLVFSILADFNNVPAEPTNGSIQWVQMEKTSHPMVPARS